MWNRNQSESGSFCEVAFWLLIAFSNAAILRLTVSQTNNGARNWMNIGYYESWNYDRGCLNMRAASIDTTKYTHIHWAFATVSSSWGVSINDTYKQWNDFKNLPVKRIISFGGWGYSTEPATYDRLRQAMSPANRGTFIDNIVNFVSSEGIDGVDFDWEYPGASASQGKGLCD